MNALRQPVAQIVAQQPAEISMREFTVRTGCEIAEQWHVSGETITLTTEPARELAPPFGDVVSPVNSERGSGDAGFNGTKRRKRKAAQ